jgi:hypothetical protein
MEQQEDSFVQKSIIDTLKSSKVLFLNLKEEPFEVMVTGEKDEEYRDIKPWSDQRLLNKDRSFRQYDYVKFVQAYKADNPFFYCKFKGTKIVSNVHKKYSNGFEVHFDDERYAIMLGEIILTGNLK